MHVDRLKIYHFRNLRDSEVYFSPGVNFLTGDNGQGKTNLIEAIYLLSIGKSFRTQSNQELIRWGEEEGSVFGTVGIDNSQLELGVSLLNSGKSKSVYFNGERIRRLNDFYGKLAMVSFTPSDLALVQGGPQERRRFVDSYLSLLSRVYLDALLEYQKALKSKNLLLKSGVFNDSDISSWNEILAPRALIIWKHRCKFLAKLQELAELCHAKFSANDGLLQLQLEIQKSQIDLDNEDSVRETFHSYLGQERMFRRSLFGPQLDEVAITIDGKRARSFASQGQTRSIVLALKWAVVELLEQERGQPPILLLDDVMSELDTGRGQRFLQMVLGGKRQVFITGTDTELLKLCEMDTNVSKLSVHCGVVSQEQVQKRVAY